MHTRESQMCHWSPSLILTPHNSICINALGYTDIFLLLSAQFVTSTHSTLSVSACFLPVTVFVCVCVCYVVFVAFSDGVCVCVCWEWVMWLRASSWICHRICLAICSPVCLLSLLLLFDCYQTSVCLRECVCVCVRVICQCLPPESDILQRISAWHTHTHARTHIYWIKMYTHSFTQNFHLQFYSSLPQGLSVYVCTFKRFHVYWCVSHNTHTQTHILACLPVCGCEKIDLSSVTAGPRGIRGLNGCLSQRCTHTYSSHMHTHTQTFERAGLRPLSLLDLRWGIQIQSPL